MATIDTTSEEGLDTWTRETLTNVNRQGDLLDCWEGRHAVLVEWIIGVTNDP